jgi:hypothetical protein
MAAKTTRKEMKSFANKHGAEEGSEIVGYSYKPSDGFLQSVLMQKSIQDEGTIIGDRILDGTNDGNDESYRRTTVATKTVVAADGHSYRRSELSLARQIAEKTDQEAVIRVISRNKGYRADSSKQSNSSTALVNVIPPYTKFFLESVAEDRMEKQQVIETFGDFIVFFFGRRPEVYQFSGRLLNVKNHDWKNDFQEVYDHYLRGTKAVENNSTVFMQYDDVLVEGFIINCHLEYHGVSNNECPFSFSMLVTDRAPVNQIQRLRDRRARTRFTAAEQQLIDDLNKMRSTPKPFALMQKALGATGLETSDVVLYKEQNNKIESSNPANSSILDTAGDKLSTEMNYEDLVASFSSTSPK